MTDALTLGVSFAADEVNQALDFWIRNGRGGAGRKTIPYGQLWPYLSGPQANSANGCYGLIIRREDLAAVGELPAETAHRFISALQPLSSTHKCLVICAPGEDIAADVEFYERVDAALSPEASVVDGAGTFARYKVDAAADPIGQRVAHLPYTTEAMYALATDVVRWWDLQVRPPVKLIAVDADDTLWQGVLGEDWAAGVVVAEGHERLHDQLSAAAGHGVVLALLTKNDEADVISALSDRDDIALSPDDFLKISAGWSPKPQRLQSILDQFAVAQKSAVFLDDNPVECGAMTAQLPAVTVGHMPPTEHISDFVDHFWPLDRRPSTEEDLARRERYRDEAARLDAKAGANSLSAFFDSLRLEVDIEEATQQDLDRLSQLTVRTTQFNTVSTPVTPTELSLALATRAQRVLSVRVKDRFGDYGLVGLLQLDLQDRLWVRQFLLSCRVLGRGVEAALIRHIGDCAAQVGTSVIAFDVRETTRNVPVRRFLQGLPTATSATTSYTLQTSAAQEFSFDPEKIEQLESAGSEVDTSIQAGLSYSEIARELSSGNALRARINGPVVAATDDQRLEERVLAELKSVLGRTDVTLGASWSDLGMKSLTLARLYARLPLMSEGQPIPNFATLFGIKNGEALLALLVEKTDPAGAVPPRVTHKYNAAGLRARREKSRRRPNV